MVFFNGKKLSHENLLTVDPTNLQSLFNHLVQH